MVRIRWTLPLSYTHRTYASGIVRLRQHGTFLFLHVVFSPYRARKRPPAVKIQRLRTS